MRKTLLTCISIMAIIGCKKADWTAHKEDIGRKFNYPAKDFANDFKNMPIKPINPFTIDSINPVEYQGNGGYWVHSANGFVKILDGNFVNSLLN